VLDVTLWPLEKQRQESASKRRIGVGFTGLANMLSMMGYAYNTQEALLFTEALMRTMRDTAYRASVELAKEKGPFPLLDVDKYLEEGTFASRLPEDIKADIRVHGIRNSHILSIAPVGCVTPDTLVITENGLHEISEMGKNNKDQWQDINIQVMTDEGFKTSDKFFNNGVKPVKRITDNYGYNITATDNHQLRVITETGDYIWKRLDQLKIGDILVKCVNTYPNINTLPIPNNETNVNHKSINKLKENIVYTKGIAELVGFLMSNGNVKTERHIRLYHHIDYAEKTFSKIIKTLEEDLGIVNSKIFVSARVNNPNLAELNIYSKELVTWLTINDSIKKGASYLKIPKWVLNSSREIVYSFLRGLYEGDGSGGLTSVTYTSIDKLFINKLQQVLASIGIVTRKDISGYGGAVGRFGNNDVYRLSIGNRKDKFKYYKNIGFMSDKGSQILVNYNEELDYRTYYQSVRKTLTKAFGCIDYKNKVYTKLKELGVTEEIMFTEIINIEDLEPTLTVDISVPDNVTYIANSFVSHNTISLAFADNASNGIEPPFSLAYTRKKRMQDGTKQEYAVIDHSLRVYLNTLEKDYSDKLLNAIVNYKTTFEHNGKSLSVKEAIPKSIVTALELTPSEHIAMMKVVQPYIDSSLSKCVAKGTPIITNKGILPIESLGYANIPDKFDKPLNDLLVLCPDGEWREVTSHYYGGFKPTITISLNNGQTIEASETHMLMTDKGWVKMPDLSVGDCIKVRREVKVNYKGGALLPTIDFYCNSKDYNIPTHMTPSLALFLGMMAADGHLELNTGMVNITKNEPLVGVLFNNLSVELFNAKDVKHLVDPRNGVNSWYFTSRSVCRWLTNLIGYRAGDKHVPTEILSGSYDEMRMFLSGLSLDGYRARPDKGTDATYIYFGKSKQLALGGFSLLKAIGYNPRLTSKKVIGYDYIAHGVSAKGVDFCIEQRKNTEDSLAVEFIKIPEEVLNGKLLCKDPNYSTHRNWRQRNNTICKESHYINNFNNYYDKNFIYYKITEITNTANEIYDIEVKDSHDYLIDGVVSHNTVNIPADYPFDDFKTVYDQAWVGKLKGVATYRPNDTLGSVLSVGVEVKEEVKVKVETDTTTTTVTTIVKEEDPFNTFIIKRPNGTLSSRTKKVEYLSSSFVKDDFYVGVSFLNDIKRPIEVFFTVCPDGVSQEWLDSYAINLSLLARGGLDLFCKALRADRRIKSDKGQIRYGWYTKSDGSKVPRYHTSEVACMAYAIQELLVEENIITEQGFPIYSEDAKEVHKSTQVSTIQSGFIPGKLCTECGANAVIKKDGCTYCTNCHALGECG